MGDYNKDTDHTIEEMTIRKKGTGSVASSVGEDDVSALDRAMDWLEMDEGSENEASTSVIRTKGQNTPDSFQYSLEDQEEEEESVQTKSFYATWSTLSTRGSKLNSGKLSVDWNDDFLHKRSDREDAEEVDQESEKEFDKEDDRDYPVVLSSSNPKEHEKMC